jgi:hypothetical protein
VGEHVEESISGNKENHAHGPVDDSSTGSTGDHESQEVLGEIEKRKQVDLGNIYSHRPSGVQDSVDPGRLGNQLEGKVDVHETSLEPSPPMEITIGVKVEKPKKKQPLLIIRKPEFSSPHLSNVTQSERGNYERTGGESGLVERGPERDKSEERDPCLALERTQEDKRVESEEHPPNKVDGDGNGGDSTKHDFLRRTSSQELGRSNSLDVDEQRNAKSLPGDGREESLKALHFSNVPLSKGGSGEDLTGCGNLEESFIENTSGSSRTEEAVENDKEDQEPKPEKPTDDTRGRRQNPGPVTNLGGKRGLGSPSDGNKIPPDLDGTGRRREEPEVNPFLETNDQSKETYDLPRQANKEPATSDEIPEATANPPIKDMLKSPHIHAVSPSGRGCGNTNCDESGGDRENVRRIGTNEHEICNPEKGDRGVKGVESENHSSHTITETESGEYYCGSSEMWGPGPHGAGRNASLAMGRQRGSEDATQENRNWFPDLSRNVEQLKIPTETFREAEIKWNNWTTHAFFREEKLEEDIRKRIKDVWGLKKKFVYLIINGHGYGYIPESWPLVSSIRVVIKAPGGAEVVIQGPGGWQIELNAEKADSWLGKCGLIQAEILGWTFQTRLQGGEKVIMLKNPREGLPRNEVTEEGGLPVDIREFRRRRDLEDEFKGSVQIWEPGRPIRTVSLWEAWDWACDWISRNGIGSIVLKGRDWKFEKLKEGDLLKVMWERKLQVPEYMDLDPPAVRERIIRKTLNPDIPEEEDKIENDKKEETLWKRLCNGTWHTAGTHQYDEWKWEKVKEKLKTRNAGDGCDLLGEWAGQNPERTKKQESEASQAL